MGVMHQEIQYCTAPDGVRLAYSIIGKGTPVVRTPHWFAHLEYDLKAPIYRHQILGLAHRHSLLRYDGRGIGLSQRDITDISFERRNAGRREQIDDIGIGIETQNTFGDVRRGGNPLGFIEPPVVLDGAVRNKLRGKEFPIRNPDRFPSLRG
jgi:hypothetical protein